MPPNCFQVINDRQFKMEPQENRIMSPLLVGSPGNLRDYRQQIATPSPQPISHSPHMMGQPQASPSPSPYVLQPAQSGNGNILLHTLQTPQQQQQQNTFQAQNFQNFQAPPNTLQQQQHVQNFTPNIQTTSAQSWNPNINWNVGLPSNAPTTSRQANVSSQKNQQLPALSTIFTQQANGMPPNMFDDTPMLTSSMYDVNNISDHLQRMSFDSSFDKIFEGLKQNNNDK